MGQAATCLYFRLEPRRNSAGDRRQPGYCVRSRCTASLVTRARPRYDDFAKRKGMGMNDDPQRKTPGGITGKGFVPGDPRCNRNGRPKGFDELRRQAQMILWEPVVWADGRTISRIEMIFRQWSRSKNPKLQMLFMEIAFGPVPPAKVEANDLEPRTTLVLRFPLELGDRGPSTFRVLQPSDDGASRAVKGR